VLLEAEEEQPSWMLAGWREENVPCSSFSSSSFFSFLRSARFLSFFSSSFFLMHRHTHTHTSMRKTSTFLHRRRWCCYCEFFHHFFTATMKKNKNRKTAKEDFSPFSLSLPLFLCVFLLCYYSCDPDDDCNVTCGNS